MSLSADIVNQALMVIGGNQPPVTGSAPYFDGSTAGKAAAALYAPAVASIARQHEWGFARKTAVLTLTGNTAPFPWLYEYAYPAGCVQIWQLAPAALADVNNPLPVNSAIGNAIVNGGQGKVIWTNQQNALAVFNANPLESTWDALFREAVVRLLSSEMAMAVAGKPDTSQNLLESGGAFETLAEGREG